MSVFKKSEARGLLSQNLPFFLPERPQVSDRKFSAKGLYLSQEGGNDEGFGKDSFQGAVTIPAGDGAFKHLFRVSSQPLSTVGINTAVWIIVGLRCASVSVVSQWIRLPVGIALGGFADQPHLLSLLFGGFACCFAGCWDGSALAKPGGAACFAALFPPAWLLGYSWSGRKETGVLFFLQLCELILILSFGYFCRCASRLGWQDGRLVWSDKRQLIGGIFLLVLLFLSTLSFSIYQIQPGMVLAISLLLAVMVQFGVQGASVYGVTLTLACCCYSADLLEGCLILACSAFLGSLFQSAGKAVQLMVFFLTSLFLALMISVNQAMLVLLGEELLGIGFYLVLPKRWLKAFAFPIQEKQPVSAGEQAALLRIQSCGEALQRQGKRLYQWQKKRPAQPEKPYSNTRQEIRREICATCPRVLHCRCQPGEQQIQQMEQYLLHTKSNHPDRSQINRLSPCGRVDAILSLVQRQMEQRVQRHQFNRQKRRLLRLAAEQMDALGGAMKELSQDLQHQGRELPQLEKQTAALLAELDLEADWICCRWEEEKRLILELALPNVELPSIAKLTRHLSLGLEQPLQAAEPVEVHDQKLLRFFSPPPLELEVGCCQMEKETGQPCGDTFFAFQDGYGLWYLFLADGMGTGTLAAQDSQALAGLAPGTFGQRTASIRSAPVLQQLFGIFSFCGKLLCGRPALFEPL